MVNKLDVKGIALASAIVMAILYLVCFVIVLALGDASLKFFQLFFHGISLESLRTTPNFGLGVLGFIVTVITSYVTGAIFALIYNKFAK